MFKVEVYVEEKKLADLLWAFDGKIVGNPEITLVRGAEKAKNSNKVISSQPMPGMNLPQQVAAILLEHKSKVFNNNQIKEMIAKIGGNPTSISYVLQYLTKEGLLKRTATGIYSVQEKG